MTCRSNAPVWVTETKLVLPVAIEIDHHVVLTNSISDYFTAGDELHIRIGNEWERGLSFYFANKQEANKAKAQLDDIFNPVKIGGAK